LLARALMIDPHELDAALSRDRESSDLLAWSGAGSRDQPPLDDGHRPSAERLAREAAENEGMICHVH
jgi:hypothetical protein